MYGCTDDVISDTATWLHRCGKAAFHPLVLPMIFAELERSRFVNAADARANQLNPRIIALRNRANRTKTTASNNTMSQVVDTTTTNETKANRLDWVFNATNLLITALYRKISELRQRANGKKSTTTSNKNSQSRKTSNETIANGGQPTKDTTTDSDCDAIDIARSMRSLKNGLESFQEQLTLMEDHLQALTESEPGLSLGASQGILQEPKVHIEGRLQEMSFELRSKVRSCEALVGTMTLVTQMV